MLGPFLLDAIALESGESRAARSFIEQRFKTAFSADLSVETPLILRLMRSPDSIIAAVGMRPANNERLFLEHYTQGAIEGFLTEHGETPRAAIAEIAHLAGVEPGISRYLFPLMTVLLQELGFRWVVFTGTRQLMNSFHRLEIATQVIADARPECLPSGSKGSWGTYYDNCPKVIAVRLEDAAGALSAKGYLRRIKLRSGICFTDQVTSHEISA